MTENESDRMCVKIERYICKDVGCAPLSHVERCGVRGMKEQLWG